MHYNKTYATVRSTRVNDKSALLLWHQRLGHRNFKDTASLLGFALPDKLPLCIPCIEGKSKRHRLTGSSGLHTPIRPGYSWAWDHAGPFSMCTWGGNWYLSVKVDIFSGYVVTNLTQSTADCFDEWSTHVKQVDAHFGRQVVAQMITDSAPYFEERQLQNFNKERGIIHVQSPPYTQELNGLAERTIDTGWCYHHHPPFYARHDRRYPHQAPAARVLCAFCV